MVIMLVVFGGLLKGSFVIVLLPFDAIASDLLRVPGLPFGGHVQFIPRLVSC
jgi:hypothetical protein